MRKRFDRVSLAVGALGVLLILASLLVTVYRFSLPWEGWSYTRDLSGAGRRLIFNENIAAASIGIRHDDLLLTVEGRPVEDLLADAVGGRPKRPPRWEGGSLVVYTVSRTQFGGAFWGGQFFNSLIWPFLIAPLYVNLFWRFPVTKRPLREYHRATSLLLYGLVPALTFAVWLLTHEQTLVFWDAWATLSGVVFVSTLLIGMASVA